MVEPELGRRMRAWEQSEMLSLESIDILSSVS